MLLVFFLYFAKIVERNASEKRLKIPIAEAYSIFAEVLKLTRYISDFLTKNNP